MTNTPKTITGISAGSSRLDGEGVKFRLETVAGNADFECDRTRLHNIIQYLIWVADDAAKKRTGSKLVPLPTGRLEGVSPLPCTEVGCMTWQDPDTVLLIIRNFDYDFGFELDKKMLRDLERAFGQTAQALEADPRPH